MANNWLALDQIDLIANIVHQWKSAIIRKIKHTSIYTQIEKIAHFVHIGNASASTSITAFFRLEAKGKHQWVSTR